MAMRVLRTLCSGLLLLGLGCAQHVLGPQGPLPAQAPPAADLAPSAVPPPPESAPPPPVSTVKQPQPPRGAVSLAECICLALENGRTGEFYDRVGSDRQTSAAGSQQGPASAATDAVRVFAVEPAVAATE